MSDTDVTNILLLWLVIVMVTALRPLVRYGPHGASSWWRRHWHRFWLAHALLLNLMLWGGYYVAVR